MSAQKVDTEIRQIQIVQAALDLIGSDGVQALNIASVAERVGLVPSGIYRHFGSKDELLNATLDLIEERLLGNIMLVRKQSEKALNRLKLLLIREINLLMENQAIPHIVFSETIFTGSIRRKAKVRALITRYLHEIEKIVKEGQERGELRKDISALTIVLMFKGMVLPAVVLWKITDGGVDLIAHAEEAWELFYSAVSLHNNKILEKDIR